MKLTKKLEAEILKVYNTVWDAYLRGDMRTFASILDENCYIIGSAAGEVFSNKKTAVKYYKSTAEEITGKAEFRNRKIKVMPVEKGVMVNEKADFYLLIDDQWTFYGPGRISSLFHKKNNKWKVIHQHGSFPDSKTEEGEQVNTDKIKVENIQLRDAVKRRTEELENKNRELEIEAALERVRARAMAMQSSDELVEVANVMRQQMVELGQSGFDTAAVHLYSDDSEYFDSWYSFRQGDPVTGKIVTGKKKFKKDACKMLREMVKAYHSKQSDYTIKGSGEKLREWFSFLAKTIPEIKIKDKNPRSNYIHFSDFSGGSLVMATYEPPTKDSMLLQKRCATVFDLAYRRYIDLKKAEAQVREAQIEAALERVRSLSIGMQKSIELGDVVHLLDSEITGLGIKVDSTSIITDFSEFEKGLNNWIAIKGKSYLEKFHIPYKDDFVIKKLIDAITNGVDYYTEKYSRVEKNRYFKWLFKYSDFKKIPNERQQFVFDTPGWTRAIVISKNSFLVFQRYKFEEFTEEEGGIFKRFGKVFEQSYTRFLDLQKAEAQAREAQIELGLERVRVRAMTMHSSDELNDLVKTLFGELIRLDVKLATCLISTFDISTLDETSWMFHPVTKEPYVKRIPYNEQLFYHEMLRAWKERNAAWNYCLEGEAKVKWHDFLFADTEFALLPQSVKDEMQRPDKVFFTASYYSYGAIQVASLEPFPAQSIDIIQRFSKVFDLSYTRFLDLKKAEAQAREAQIELALERVRAKTMAMQKPSEFVDVINIIGEQFVHLGFDIDWVNFGANGFAISEGIDIWNFAVIPGASPISARVFIPYFDHPVFTTSAATINEFLNGGKDFVTVTLDKQTKDKWLDHLFTKTIFKDVPEEYRVIQYAKPGYATSNISLKDTWLSIGKFDIKNFTDEQHTILRRFANAFGQAYTRFLDLQNAEAQAKEAQIEAALERVRARSMAMHHSSELHAAADVLFQQLRIFGGDIMNAGIALCTQGADEDEYWLSSDSGLRPVISIPHTEDSVQKKLYEDWKNKSEFFSIAKGGDELKAHYNYMQSVPSLKPFFKEGPDWSFPTWQKWHAAYFSHGYLFMITLKPYEEEKILVRFAKVFEQAYTRFLDLQRAEAQAREAQIEASLERVRSRAMAMQSSEQLRELIGTVFTELTKLDIVLTRCLIMIYDPKSNDSVWWMANSEAPTQPIGLKVQYHEYPSYLAYVNAWKQKELKWTYTLEGNTKKEWDDFLFVETELSHLPDFVIAGMKAPDRVYLNASFNSFGNLTLATLEPLSGEHFDIMLRFAKVFDLTYTRFNDLKQAEAQAREARIETALERVRARTMAMQKSDELPETTFLLFQQLKDLGETAAQLSIGIIKEEEGYVELSATVHGNQLLQSYHVPADEPYVMRKAVKAWKEKQRSLTLQIDGPELKNYNDWRNSVLETKINFPEDRWIVNIVFFSKGMLSFSSDRQLSKETLQLLERFTGVFDLTYTRFLDLKKAEAQTREAQIELALERVRARTMAMHKSEELAETSQVLFHQLSELGGIPDRISIAITDEVNGVANFWSTDQQGSHLDHSFSARLNERTTIAKAYQAWKEQKKSLVIDLHGEELNEWILFAREEMGIAVKDDQIKDRRVHTVAFFSHGWILVTSHEPQSTETIQILERFASVFNLTYRRFLDLEKAEAQAREAQIETVLERVRSRTMAMQKSDELTDVAGLLFEQVSALGIKTWTAGFNVWSEDNNSYIDYITSPQGGFIEPYTVYTDTAEALTDISNARKSGVEFDVQYVEGEKIKQLYLALTKLDEKQYEVMLQDGVRFPSHQYEHFVFGSKVSLMFITYEPVPEAHDIFKRLGKVFEQTYTRFLDLQKAEAQVREAQIEGSLERVRSKTMAMHNSQDVGETVAVMFDELRKLDVETLRCGVGIMLENYQMELWTARAGATGKVEFIVGNIDMKLHPLLTGGYEAWKNRAEGFFYQLKDEDLKTYFDAINSHQAYPAKYDISSLPSLMFHYEFNFNEGCLFAFSTKKFSDESSQIFKRFASVFGQTYRRYLDLQKAEAQARQAQIEASLERVRASAMAMHRSDELSNVLAILFEQFDVLKIQPVDVHLDLFDLEKNTFSYRATGKEGKRVIAEQIVDLGSRPEWQALLQNWKNGKPNTVDFSYYPKEVIRELMAFFPEIWAAMPEDAIMSPEDFPDGIFDALGYCKFGYIGFHHHRKATEEEQRILIRFANEFERLYQRFLDLQKAEAQARDAQIEASLERVRSKTMAMHNSQDVGDTVASMFDELVKLGVETVRCGIGIMHEPNQMEVWTARKSENEKVELIIGRLDMTIHPLLQGMYNGWKNKDVTFTYELRDNDLVDYFTKLINSPEYQIKYDIASLPQHQFHYDFYFPEGALFAFSAQPLSIEASQIFKRFTGVFGQTYRRYLDLQKAEAQAREAQIEASLERVRSKTMAMHNSQDVGNTVATMLDELVKLGVETVRCGIAIIDESKTMEVWTASTKEDGSVRLIIGQLDMKTHPLFMGVYDAWKNKVPVTTYELIGEDLKDYFRAINNSPNYPTRYDIDSLPHRQSNAAFMFPEGSLFVFSQEPLVTETTQIFKRFAGVFGQTYRRYLDLLKAEANAREAQIEAGLERVRARTMAMHNSDDVTSATATMFTELDRLGIENMRCGIAHYLEDHKMEVWSVSNLADGKVVRGAGILDTNSIPFWKLFYSTWQKKEDFLYYYMAGKEKEEYFKKISNVQNYLNHSIEDVPDLSIQAYYFPEGSVWAFSLKPHSEEDKQVMKRFASVFSLTFRRYQDLQKAEAQTREATIEAALEKVRGKAMAMHNSNDLSTTASIVFTELRKLGISPIRCGVGLLNKESRKGQIYAATSSNEEDSLSLVGWVQLSGHPVLEKIYDTWKNNEDYFPELNGEQMKTYYDLLLSGLSVSVPDTGEEQYGTFLPFSVGCLYAWSETPYNDSELKILKRFASIIDLTFRRYIELQKSEATAKEAIKQAALDRIRADIASMRTINDLDRITPLIWNELTILGIPFIRCGVFIMDNEQELIHTFLSTPDGKAIAAFHLPYDTPGNLRHVVTNWKKNKKYIDHWDETEFIQFADILVKGGALISSELYLKTIPKGGFYLHFLPFLQGMLYVGNTTQLKQEEIELIQHVADAFSTAYARYEDFNKLESAKQQVEKTLTDLKQAQTQLVQAEKMASLGELTAGIAHEIQNPLNFVNNFSEVSKELLDEMKTELETGNTEDAKDIADDVIQNLEKINHHGKRADAIVKSMLQHSRSSSGKKEPTDINALADEYLRLAYHGLRAKDKSFNAKFETEFDNSIGKVNIISQDIGRVLVNLINNAFYAVSERKKQESNGYEPTVEVLTKKTDDKIEIKVKDNGNGIPKKVLDKIFQPFFTTKPTGQGTGLGLSLAYDIITKGHGGELKVETKEGEGSEFIIQLPAN